MTEFDPDTSIHDPRAQSQFRRKLLRDTERDVRGLEASGSPFAAEARRGYRQMVKETTQDQAERGL